MRRERMRRLSNEFVSKLARRYRAFASPEQSRRKNSRAIEKTMRKTRVGARPVRGNGDRNSAAPPVQSMADFRGCTVLFTHRAASLWRPCAAGACQRWKRDRATDIGLARAGPPESRRVARCIFAYSRYARGSPPPPDGATVYIRTAQRPNFMPFCVTSRERKSGAVASRARARVPYDKFCRVGIASSIALGYYRRFPDALGRKVNASQTHSKPVFARKPAAESIRAADIVATISGVCRISRCEYRGILSYSI